MARWKAGPAVSDVIPLSDPGQIGAGAVVNRHVRTSAPSEGDFSQASVNGHGTLQPDVEHFPGPSFTHGFVAAGGTEVLTLAPMHQGTEGGGSWTGREQQGAPVDSDVPEEHNAPARLRSWLFKLWKKDDQRLSGMGRPDYDTDDADPTPAATANTNRIEQVDPRRVTDAGKQLMGAEESPSPEQVRSAPADVIARTPTGPPADVRSGDPKNEGRPATVARWSFWRPFDKNEPEQFTGARAAMNSPGVSLPIRTTIEAPGKEPAPGMEPWGLAPSTWRTQPEPWAQDLVDDGTVSPASHPRLRAPA